MDRTGDKMTEDRSADKAGEPFGLSLRAAPRCNIVFQHNGKQTGELDFNGPEMKGCGTCPTM
mgnify:CR=1 FL=1